MPLLMTLAHFVRVFKLLFGVEEQIDEIIRSFSTGWVIFEDSGHFPFIEERDKFVATVRDWVNNLG